ncbi:putative sterol O-acyltransferase 2 [Escovopsis weberi]|uniref:O-acyltransferase n=1 Tax=Escovopsis weberi TaxID=150374 RepID=A0A0M9VS17_ESCWE|nr:putative sterol O-acyltransferase 2 [Escovopsis weberi]
MASSLDAVANGSALRRREDHHYDHDHDDDHETAMLRPKPRKIAHSQLLIDDHGQVLVNGPIAGLAAEPSIPSGMTSGRSTPVSDNAPPSAKSLSTARKRVRAEQRRRIFPTTDFASRLSHFDPDSDYRDFHGFFNLFWIGLAIMGITTMLRNMKDTGHLMHVQIWSLFTDKLSSLALADFLMVSTTATSLPLHRVFRASPAGGALSWARGGMAIQIVFQAVWLAVWIAVPFWFEWTWTAQVFLLLHTMVLLMKMHSYAFYNGHLSETEKRLRSLDVPDPSSADRRPAYFYPSAEYRKGSVSGISLPANLMDGVVDGGGGVLRQRTRGKAEGNNGQVNGKGRERDDDMDNDDKNNSNSTNYVQVGDRVGGTSGRHHGKADQEKTADRRIDNAGSAVVDDLREDLARELTSPIGNVTYPRNLSWPNYLDFLLCPTLCYELEYPRNSHINWGQLVSKVIATFGCIFLLTVTSEEFILPVLVDAERRLAAARGGQLSGGHGSMAVETLLVLAETISWLLFPFMLTFLLIFLVIFEYVLGAFAEITCFADRHFYADWWNSTDWMEFSREWNVPVYSFLRRHVYSASRPHTGKHAATVITFLISAVGHEIVMACITKKVRGYGFFCQMLQLPIVMLQRTKWVRGRATLNNVCFWCSMILGLSL